MHRRDIRRLGLTDKDTVRVISRRGAIEAQVWESARMRRGCVWMPLHFPDSLTNKLTNDAGDSVTGTGEYKVCAVRVEELS
jgi:anaerobic selenocysteine-containing dehydrogenase